MNSCKRLALLLFGSLLSAPAFATVLIGQTPSTNPAGSTSSGTIRMYDDFRLASDASIGTVSWWAGTSQPTTAAFNISFTTMKNGWQLDETVYSTDITATSAAVDTHMTLFTVTLPIPVLLTGGTNYYLSIYRTDGMFIWTGSQTPGVNGYFNGSDISLAVVNGNYALQQINTHWELGTAPLPAVPEPASWAMVIAGAGLAGATLRRRRTMALA